MLETEEMDDDYFTPASSTSLANIFGKTRKEDGTENESLKYTPPKPSKPEETKATQCVYACAILGYEWLNNTYVLKGQLGFAILKILKTGIHNLVLYDSNKITLSCATISAVFEVTIKENVYLSYHDNQQKYWSLNASSEEIKKIVEFLKSWNVTIKYSSNVEKGPLETNIVDNINSNDDGMKKKEVTQEKESDTDSSVNRKTKMSILNRMASMGQSVLPSRTTSIEKTSDSSDTNDTSHYKTIRHKPVKSSMKRNTSDKNLSECQSLVETGKVGSLIMEHSNNNVPLFTYINGQLVPVTNTNIVTSPSNTSGNDMSLFVSEQRISNTEIRINMNRMTDKVDQILGQLTHLEHKDKSGGGSDFQTEILQKLLAEYESKIKMYEGFIKSQELDKDFNAHLFGATPSNKSKQAESENEPESEKNQKLEQNNKEKDIIINDLEAKIKALQDNFNETALKEKSRTDTLLSEIVVLQQSLDAKNKELPSREVISEREDDDIIGNKIKNIMNDTFRAISANFENHEQYSGERVKAVIAAVIKKVTIESLNDL